VEYWHNLIIEKSWQVLKNLHKLRYDFILIGGWAVWLYTKALKSKDIDLICDFDALSKLKEDYDIFKNTRLRKYEAKIEDVDVDIYLPYFSNPGLKAEEIAQYVKSREGFKVPRPEILLIIKQKAFQERVGTPRGEKDKLDIISLLLTDLDFDFYRKLLKKYKLNGLRRDLIELLKNTTEVKELNLNPQKFAKIKKEIFSKLAGRNIDE
jgi:hypothetical protein